MAQNAKINPPADESNLKSKSLNLKSFNICHVVLPCRQAGLPFAICVLRFYYILITIFIRITNIVSLP
jgi:hypothetical protein